MRVALITTNIVLNIIDCESIPADNFGFDLAIESAVAKIGDTYINGEFVSPEYETIPIELPEPTVYVPEITAFQAKAALAQAGLYGAVEEYMATAPILTKLRWQETLTFKRDNQALIDIATELGITPTQLDSLFELGATFTL